MTDALFLIDILLTFNSATLDDDYETEYDRCKITKNYLKGWFIIDLISILPFNLIFEEGETKNLVRYIRIGRITKLFKLIKLARLLKLQKSTSFSILEYIQGFFVVSKELQWIFQFSAYFVFMTHIIACFWIIAGKMSKDYDEYGTPWIVTF